MDAKDLKSYLSEDPERIIKTLEHFGFHSFNIYDERVTSALPNGDNDTSVNVYYDNEYLNCVVWSRGAFKGDIFTVIEKFAEISFSIIMRDIHKLFGLKHTGHVANKSQEVLNIINYSHYIKLKKAQQGVDLETNKMYNDDILRGYAPYPHEELIQEGISFNACNKFSIHTDMEDERLLFPHYDWNEHNKIVGIQGRKINMDNYTAKALGIPKYINYIKGYKKESNLYGWSQNHQNIIDKKELIIFEGEKSVLKDDTFKRGLGNSVSVGNHFLSKQQIVFILRNTPPDAEIIIGFDNDIFSNLDKYDRMLENIESLIMVRKVSILKDIFNHLDDKDAPVDKGYRFYKVLYDYRQVL